MPQKEMLYIENLDELLDKLSKYPTEFQRTFLQAMKYVTFKILGRARMNSPVDTGRLRASLFNVVKPLPGGVEGMVGSPVVYAPHVEKPGGTRGVGRRPFLEPAITEHVDDIVRDFERFAHMLAKKLGF